MTFISAFFLALTPAVFSAFASAQNALPVSVITKDPLIVTSASQERLCGYLANDPKKQLTCVPDLAEVPYAQRATGEIKVTSGMFCTYSVDGVRCSGDSFYVQLFAIPDLKNVTELALPAYAGTGVDACAITAEAGADSKAVCWGSADLVTSVPKDLQAPTKIVTSGQNACALGRDGYVKCWGKDEIGNSPYGVRDLRKLVMTDSAACVIDAYGLMCWGPKGEAPRDIAADGYAKDVAMIDSQTCVLTFEHQVRCFGEAPYDVPEFVKPLALSSLGHTFCATDVDGLKCWGRLSELPSLSTTPRLPFPAGRRPRPGNCVQP